MSVSASGYQLNDPVEVDRPKPDHKNATNAADKQRIAMDSGAISLDQAIELAAAAGQATVLS